MSDLIKGFFSKYHAIPVTDRNGSSRYEHATAAQLADWLRDRDERVRGGNTALSRERSELLAAVRGRLKSLRATDASINDFALLSATLAVVERP